MKTLLVCALALVPVFAQQPPEGAKPQRPAPKNLKILKPQDIRGTMQAFKTALGVECTHCHVQGDFASDDKPQKETARMMMGMTHEINAKFPEGKMHVSCFTCHRGAVEPQTAPAASAAAPAPAVH